VQKRQLGKKTEGKFKNLTTVTREQQYAPLCHLSDPYLTGLPGQKGGGGQRHSGVEGLDFEKVLPFVKGVKRFVHGQKEMGV